MYVLYTWHPVWVYIGFVDDSYYMKAANVPLTE